MAASPEQAPVRGDRAVAEKAIVHFPEAEDLVPGRAYWLAGIVFHLRLSNYWMGKQTMNRPTMLKGVQIKTEADKMLARK